MRQQEAQQQRLVPGLPQHAGLAQHNAAKLSALTRKYGNRIQLTLATGPPPLTLLHRAQSATRHPDTLAHITTTARHTAVSLWDQSRVWDPGD